MAHGGIAMFVPAGFQRWRRGAHGRSRRQRAVPHQTMQPWEPSSLSLSWPAAKPAIPMLTGLAGNTKRLIIVWEAVHALQYLPQRYLKATRPWREAEATELLRSRFRPHGGSGINPPLAPGTWPQLPDGD